MYTVYHYYNNDYRCCCHKYWASPDLGQNFGQLEEALAQIPDDWAAIENARLLKSIELDERTDIWLHSEFEAVVVELTGSEDQEMASGRLTWEGGRGERYQNATWTVTTPNGTFQRKYVKSDHLWVPA